MILGTVTGRNEMVRVPTGTLTRHGLVSGATGTGKTRTLQLLAEALAHDGVPVVMADLKGDLTGLCQPARRTQPIMARALETVTDWAPDAYPVEFLTLGAGSGTPLRATLASFGPTLTARALGLNDTQESHLVLIFHQSPPLDTLADLRAATRRLSGTAGLSTASCGVILRNATALEYQGGADYFGPPDFDAADLLRPGLISLLDVHSLPLERRPIFGPFLLWLLARLAETLPETDTLRLVLIFDEAHQLFEDATRELTRAVVRAVKTVRSKGVGVIFASNTPGDLPEPVLGQLAFRVQHALRAYTPRAAADLRRTASAWPVSDTYNIERALRALGTGQALVSMLDADGVPTPPKIVTIAPPRSLAGPCDDTTRAALVARSRIRRKYQAPKPRAATVTEPTDLRARINAARTRHLRELGVIA